MSTFTIRVTSSATNAAGTNYGQQPDLGAPSFFDLVVSNSTDPNLPNGVYDAYCLNPFSNILLSPSVYTAQEYAGNDPSGYATAGAGVLSQAAVDRINWVLAQNFTSDPKFAGQYNYGEVQTAIWKLLGYTDSQITSAGYDRFLSDNNRNVVLGSDANQLVTMAQNAIASGAGQVPTNAYFSMVIDPAGTVQPLIVQLQSGKLGNFVWEDTDKDGIQDANEAGVDNVIVELYDGQGHLLATTRTGDDFSTVAVEHGFYQFTGLKAGDYQVKFVAPTYTFTAQDSAAAGATDANDSDANVLTGLSQVVTLASGASNQTVDAGLVKPTASLGDRLWTDSDGDGVQDAGEAGIEGATVTLIGGGADGVIGTGGDDTTQTTTTGLDGIYAFTGLNVGEEYQVQFAAPNGTVFTKANQGDDAADSDADATTGRTQVVTLTAGENNTTLDAGVYVPVAIGDKVFDDKDADGRQDDGEPGIDGVKVRLYNCVTGEFLRETTTANGGLYDFAGLPPGTYHVEFETPNGFVRTTANVGDDAGDSDVLATGITGCYTLSSGQTNTTVDAGFYKLASLGDYVWADDNNDGVQNDGAGNGINGVTVNLLRGDGSFVTSTTTGDDGNGNPGYYLFKDLVPGDYKVEFIKPAGYVFAKQDQGADGADSDADAATGLTIATTLESGENDLSWDAGLVKLASIGDRVWVDADKDGVQDSGEAGVGGVRVFLLDALGNTVGTTFTVAGTGAYLFSGLNPGDYAIRFDLTTLPQGYTVTTRDAAAATDLTDSDADATGRTVVTTLTPGENDLSWDLGIQANIGVDIEKLVRGEYLMQNSGGGEGLTPGFWKNHSSYGPSPLAGWPETGLSPDASYESIFGVDVPGSAPTLLQALGTNGGGVDALLRHSAAALLNASNPYVDYAYTKAQIISMVQAAFANGSFETTKNLFAAQNELGADLSTPATSGATLVVTPDYDADTPGTGPVIPVGGTAVFTYLVKNTGATELGNVVVSDDRIPALTFVGGDTDNDGKLDTTETWTYTARETVLSNTQYVNTGTVTAVDGTSGTTVTDTDKAHYNTPALGQSIGDRVWLDANNNGLQDLDEQGVTGVTVQLKQNGQVVQTTTTDANGNYLFDVPTAGTYQVTVLAPQGFGIGKRDQGANDGLDSDIDANGTTTTINLAAGQQNLTIDAGLVRLASLGDRLWIDADADGVQDALEAGVANATVTLIGGGADGLINGVGDTTVTTTTDGNGNYRFNNLNVGEQYQVQFTAPTGTVFTTANVSGNTLDTVDSDANTSTGRTQIVTLASGEYNSTLDAGVVVLRPGIDIEKTTSGSSNSNTTAADYDNEDTANGAGVPVLTVGSDVTWTYKVTNTGNTSFAKSEIAIVDDNGTVGSTADDMSIANGKVTYVSGDNGNNVLDAGETWFYKATGTVQALNGAGATSTFDFNGNSATSGTYGNTRSYTVDGITVVAEAYSRDKTTGAWADAFLGTYGGGLGVTDSSEGDGASASTHTIDNTGRDNFIVFQFSQNVVIDKAVLGYVVTDSDLQLWIGNTSSPITTMSNTVLSSMAFTEVNATTVSTARTAEVNAGNVAGNVLIVAADTTDTSPEDFFKLQQLVLQAATTGGVYANKATVTVTGGVTDSDMSHYVTEVAKAKIGDRIWYDKNANGLQDTGETGISGVTIDLKDAVTKTVVMTTTTDANGNYNFLTKPGDYFIDVREGTLPANYAFTRPNVNNNASDAVDSDVQVRADEVQYGANLQWGQMASTSLAAGETDLTWDAGAYKVGVDVEKYVSGTRTTTSNNGCGEGADVTYWKNNCTWQTSLGTYGWSETGVRYTSTFNSVFGCNVTGGTQSLYSVLCSTGTTAREIAMRECVAAYLNACHAKVDYAYSKEQVLAQTKWCMDNANYDSTCKAFQTENKLGCNWTTAKTSWSCVVDTQLYDADAPPGLEVRTGSTVTFTYIVKNTGDTALKDVVLTDDRIANVVYQSGDTNNNGLLDTTETWTYTAQEVASAGTIKNTGTVTAKDAVGGVVGVTDKDDAYYTGSGAAKSSLGDRVWEDRDFDGIQDNNEAGVAGVKVTLTGAGRDGVFGTADDITATTTTNSMGMYEFNNLDAGKYRLDFDQAAGWFFTKQNLGTNDAADSDVDSTGKTAEITLAANQHDLTIDAGVYRKASVGDKVWQDSNHNWVQDSGEAGIGGVTVRLINSAGTAVQTTKTNSSGNYLFSNVDPGTYTLEFNKTNVMYLGVNMNTWKWGVKDVGTNDSIDSDVAGDGVSLVNVSSTSAFTLVSGQTDLTRDAAITPIVIDLNGDGIQTIARADAQGSFDLLGTGKAIASGWLSSGDGFLAVDQNGNGRIDGIGELFGGNSKGDGFAKLSSYDSNGDGLVNDLDAAFGQLMIWQDANGNHQTDAGELISLADAGVASLTTSFTELPQLDAQGNLHLERSTATMADGTSVAMTDVYFNVSAEDAAEAGVTLPGMNELLGNDNALDGLLGMAVQQDAQPAACDTADCAGAGDAGEAMRRLAALTREACHSPAAA